MNHHSNSLTGNGADLCSRLSSNVGIWAQVTYGGDCERSALSLYNIELEAFTKLEIQGSCASSKILPRVDLFVVQYASFLITNIGHGGCRLCPQRVYDQ